MSENQDQGRPDGAPKETIMKSIRGLVAEGLLNANDTVRASIVSTMISEEIDIRTRATASLLKKLEEEEHALRKIKPTFSGFNLKGEGVGEPVYTKDQLKQIKESQEKIDKLNRALEKALTDNDFSKVMEMAGNK